MSGWVVGRSDGGCYVEETGVPIQGEQAFDTEAEAINFAILCEVEVREPITRNIRCLRRRLAGLRATTRGANHG